MDNRRNIDRVPSRLFVELECSYLKGIAYTSDISPRGCQLDSTAELPPGTPLRGQFLVANQSVPFQGEVRWSRPSGSTDGQPHSASLGISFSR
jgi:hypothetical protein